MSTPQETTLLLHKRLAPLYLAAFFQGFVLWYPIEKLFMKSIGFDDAGIGIMIAFYSTIMLLTETPSGILADRWSRKGVLILASIALATSALVGGLSNNMTIFLLSTGFWGLFYAMYSGTNESIIYDTVLEETGESKEYEYFYGRLKIVDSTALVLGSLAGGFAANYFGLRSPFFATIPFVLASIILLLKFREPKLHKSAVTVPIKQHISNTFRAVLQKGQLFPILIVLVAASTLLYTLFEFDQLWIIALAAPVILFGPINALLLSTIGIGGAAANYFKMHRYTVMIGTLSVMFGCSLVLVYSRNLVLTVAATTFICASVIALNVVFSKLLHDSLNSKVRAGAASAVSTLGRIIIIPLALGFGYISKNESVFQASWVIVGLVVVILALVIKTYGTHKSLPVMTRNDA